MMAAGKFTYEEICSQPDSWTHALGILKDNLNAIHQFSINLDHRDIIFTGCGSTYHLARAAAVLFQEITGDHAIGIPASELWLSPQSFYSSGKQTILIAISRSGETTETIHACQEFRNSQNGRVMTFVCDPDSSLAKLGELNLIFPSGMEESIAQTRAFSTLYLGVVGTCAIWNDQAEKLDQLKVLPLAGRRILENYSLLAANYGRNLDLDRIYFLGSGGRFGLACELSLKMKEMSLTHSEAFHFMEFRHGPKAMVNHNTLVVGLVSQMNARHEWAVLRDMQALNAKILTIGENNTEVSFNSGVEEVFRNILYLPFGQMMAYERSIAKGLDPDHPANLDAVVKLDQ